MERVFLCFSMVLITLLAPAQLADKASHITMAELIKKEYNAQNYKAIYKVLDSDFQSKMNEKEVGDFFKFNVFDHYGTILSIDYTELKDGFHVFLVKCKNGLLDLYLACNVDEKITGMQWLPHKNDQVVPIQKNEKYVSDNPKITDWDLKLDSIVKDYMTNAQNCGITIAIYQNKKVMYYNYGETKRGTNQLPNNKTIYEIGSISKTFTGILLARAVTDKKVKLNDPVKKYLGEDYKNLAYKDKDIELVHLANHTARVDRVPFNLAMQPNYSDQNPYKNYSKQMVYAYMKQMQPDAFPGTKNEYSNLGMALLGIIEEKVYNKTYEELITEYICKPLDMPDTKITLNDDELKRFATGYAQDGTETPHWDLGDLAGCGGIRSTAEDMLKYARANLEETNPVLKLSHVSTYKDDKNNVALAWQLATTKKGNELIWHNGRTAGFTSFCGIIQSKDLCVVVLSNSGNPVDQIAIGIMKLLQ
ncbi:MAG TPA: serine hydrolase [Bacteroidia bacterium]|jgi:CubicO group peptidase (beta-lactamase class C family)|nr:serine hydrolase [Bacteroidia bacterium]